MNHPRGSEWSIWDLHVHTPASIVQHYGDDSDKTWDRYLDALSKLPSQIHVLGINDYWFLDGYCKVRAEWEAGNLPNIREIFPVVEFRLNVFGGTDGTLRRQNLHVVFDPELSTSTIQSQFLNALQASFSLLPEGQENWCGIVTREAIADLGKKVKAAAPPEKVGDYGSDLLEGFNSLVVDPNQVNMALDKHYFKDRYLIGLGKAEWAAVKWNEQSVATKRHLINRADFLFTAFSSTARWPGSVQKLKEERVLHKVLDCSDAHYWPGDPQNERLGNCRNWINAEETFAGLKHAVAEFDHRIYVGLEPKHIYHINRFPDRYISRLTVAPVGEDPHPVFDYSIDLNSQFVAIVGNKGQGKSALLDCLGLAGGSVRTAEFAFLNSKRFLSLRNRDRDKYAATVEWRDGTSRTSILSSALDPVETSARVEYLPQAFVERVCGASQYSGEAQDFERELRKVLFSHISNEERAGAADFDSLLTKRTATIDVQINELRGELGVLVAEYLSLIEFDKANPAASLSRKIAEREKAVTEAETALASAQAKLIEVDSATEGQEAVAQLRSRAEELERKRDARQRQRGALESKLARASSSEMEQSVARAKLTSLQAEVDQLNQQLVDEVLRPLELEVPLHPILELVIREPWATQADDARYDLREAVQTQLDALDGDLVEIQREISQVLDDLEQQDANREAARQRVRSQEERVATLRGSREDEGTLEWLLEVERLRETLPGKFDALRAKILDISAEIHSRLTDQTSQVRAMFSPVSEYVARHEGLRSTGLEVNVDLEIGAGFDAMRDSLDRRRSTPALMAFDSFPSCSPSDWANLSGEINKLFTSVVGKENASRDPAADFKVGFSAHEFLTDLLGLTWLRLRFELTSGGVGLTTMSPGQRGLILLLFYLLIDRSDVPLILDQPEENLDNETVASVVVPAIRDATKRRQVVLVTHNSNLAIVGDADQVIRCTFEDGSFAVESGPISELKMATYAVGVLEGTKRALSNRWHKFSGVPDSV